MFGAIVAVFVVFGIFIVVASLLGFYVWLVDRHRFAMWAGILRSWREARDGPIA
jgi:hypothetical protein